MIVITRYEDRFLGTHTLEDGLRVYYLPLENMTMGTIYPYYYCWIPCLRDVLHHSRPSRVDPSPREHPYCTLPPVHERDVSHVDSIVTGGYYYRAGVNIYVENGGSDSRFITTDPIFVKAS